MTPPLVGLAHGSRDPRVPGEIEELLAAVTARRPGLVAVPAYLDLTEPDLATAAADLSGPVAVVVPLLFTAAFHARVDTPAALAAARAATGLDLLLARHLGTGDDILDALIRRTAGAGVGDDDGILLLAVGSSDADANDEVADLARRWAGRRRGPVRAAFATVDPRASEVLAGPGWRGVVVPLFVADGLLLDATVARVPPGGRTLPPLVGLLAEVVLARYDEVVDAVVDAQ